MTTYVGAIEFVFKAKYRNNLMKWHEIENSAHLFQEEHSWKIATPATNLEKKNIKLQQWNRRKISDL